jgi:hypothetical protein
MSGSSASTSASGEDNATRAALAFRALSDESRSLELIHRYDTRYERQYYRAHRRFLEVRDRRTPPSSEPDCPSQHPAEGAFPTGSVQRNAGPFILEMPAPASPAETPATGKEDVLPNEPGKSLQTNRRSVSNLRSSASQTALSTRNAPEVSSSVGNVGTETVKMRAAPRGFPQEYPLSRASR